MACLVLLVFVVYPRQQESWDRNFKSQTPMMTPVFTAQTRKHATPLRQ